MHDRIVTISDVLGGDFQQLAKTMAMYGAAVKEMETKLSILNDEFQFMFSRNPIEYMKSRIKSPKSIIKKLEKKGLEPSITNAHAHLNDIAGIRVVCSFIDDIYWISGILEAQDDIVLLSKKDYISSPKANGYRSLHLVLEIPVFFSSSTKRVPVEIQIRTIAMDFWASLEHKIRYKTALEANMDDTMQIIKELKGCADVITETDLRMQAIQHLLEKYDIAEE